jgi:hypothetical protein
MRRSLVRLLVPLVAAGSAIAVAAPGRGAGALSPCSGTNPPPSCGGGDPASPANPKGSLDSAVRWPGGILVTGWANDPNRAGGSMTVAVQVGTAVTNVIASIARTDGAVGFQAVVPTTLSGTLSVCATAVNVGIGTSDTAIGCRSVTVQHDPFGYLDEVTSGLFSVRVRGWAIDPDTSSPITVHVYRDGAFLTAWTANASRTDVGAAYPGYGDLHGFDGVVPYPATNGTHTICVYGINTSTGTTNTQLGCKTWVETHAPPVAPAIVDLHPWQQTANSNDHLTVSFNDNSTDETRFDVLAQMAGGQWSVVASTTGSTTTGLRSVDAGLVAPLTSYCFQVNAVGTWATSSSAPSCLTTPAPPPNSPSNMAVTAVTQTTATVSWTDNATNEQGFELHHWVQGATLSEPIQYIAANPGTGTVTATLTGLTPATTYCFQVTAYNQRAAGSFTGGRTSFGSNAPCVATAAPNPPAAATGVAVVAHTQTSLRLAWTDNASNETGYRVERQSGGSFVAVATLGANTTGFTDTGLPSGSTFCYRVVAVNAGGETPSASACGTTDAVLPDLVVTNIQELNFKDPTTLAGILHSGDPFTMGWTICNVGADAGQHDTELDISDGQSTVSTSTVTVPSLAAGACSLAFQQFPNGLAANQYDAVATEDSGDAVKESNEGNNSFKLSFNILT